MARLRGHTPEKTDSIVCVCVCAAVVVFVDETPWSSDEILYLVARYAGLLDIRLSLLALVDFRAVAFVLLGGKEALNR